MKFRFTINEFDAEFSHRLKAVEFVSAIVNDFVNDRNYGIDIDEYVILCICVRFRKGYEEWYRIRKPFYIEHKVFKNKITGSIIEINKQFTQEIRIAQEIFEYLLTCSEDHAKKAFAYEVFRAVSDLESLPKKIKDFNRNAFRADLESYFKSQKLI
jgi:hypothetical protein